MTSSSSHEGEHGVIYLLNIQGRRSRQYVNYRRTSQFTEKQSVIVAFIITGVGFENVPA